MHNYVRTNAFLGIYTFTLANQKVEIKNLLSLPGQNAKPYGNVNDFTMYLNNEMLVILLLQNTLMIQQSIILAYLEVLVPQYYIVERDINSTLSNLGYSYRFAWLKFIVAIN